MKTLYNKFLLLLLMLPATLLAQSKLSGIVTDKKLGEPLPGVNVLVKGTTNGVSTGFDGSFTLTNLKQGDIITFSYLGFSEQTITFAGQNNITIGLQDESSKLDEVVVVGYGTVRKKDATGAVSQISSKDFNQGVNATPETLISGRIAGVTVTTGGAPGAKADIRIRGGSSLNASNDPLIVVDGLPLTNAVPGGATSILSSIDPNDIESFTVLKDASAAAIYGSRAANGVIVITTKKGSKNGVSFNFNSQTGINTVAKTVDVLSADQFRTLVNERGTDAQKALLGNANTDWQDEIFNTSITSTNNISASGALFKTLPVRLSVGNTRNEGVLINTRFERTTTALSLNPTFFDNHLKIDINGNLSFGKNRFQDEGNVIGSAIGFDPTQPVYDENSRYGGYFEWLETNGNLPLLPARNPVARLNQTNNRATSTRQWGNIKLDYKLHFLPDLRGIVELGIDKYKGNGFTIINTESAAGYQPNTYTSGNWVNYGSYTHFTDSRQNKNMNAYLNYVKDLGKFKIDATGGYNYQLFERVGYDSKDIVIPGRQEDVAVDPDINLQSFFGRLNLGFDERYLLTLNYRRDGSSRFSKKYRWGDFPGAAFAWNISKESFLKDNKFVSDLKLRLGYGKTGQQDISAQYDYLRRVTSGTINTQYIFGNTVYTAARPEGYNENIKWEELTETNIGLDYGLFKNRINGSVNLFRKESSDLLADVLVPDGANLRNKGYFNIGSVKTEGIEVSINTDIIKKDNINWNVAFNTTFIKQKITELGITVPGFAGYTTGSISGGTGNQIQINTVGFAPNSFYVYEQLYDANGKPIPGAYVDRNGDNVIDNLDRYRYHKAAPDYTFGLYTTLNYHKLDFSMNWRANLGNYVFDNINSDKGYLNGALRRQTDLANITTDYYNTGFVDEDNGTQRYYSDYFVKDASFIKLDNITIGYTIDKKILEEVGLRFSAGVQNALILTKYNGIDPERFSGIDGNVYPRARTFLIGVNANF